MNTYQEILEKIISFGQSNDEIVSLILIGSHARTEQHADEYSDLDLIMIVDDADRFISSNDWVEKIGKYHICFVEPTIGGQQEKRILFDNALDVDFVIVAKQYAQEVLASDEAASILSRGFKILVNKGINIIQERITEHTTPYEISSEREYTHVVNDFWYHAIWTTKKLLRGELWAAKFCVDSYMKLKLLWMIEQYAHSIHGAEFNTWYGGRFIDRWADDEVKQGLSKSFSKYNAAEMASALFETMDLFRSLAVKVSKTYRFEYPTHADVYSTNWVHEKLDNLI